MLSVGAMGGGAGLEQGVSTAVGDIKVSHPQAKFLEFQYLCTPL